MNISFFLQPKCKVAYIYNDDTIRQGLQKMNYYGYSAIPVLDENEHYVGTITEGDFLWHICRIKQNNAMEVDIKDLRKAGLIETKQRFREQGGKSSLLYKINSV